MRPLLLSLLLFFTLNSFSQTLFDSIPVKDGMAYYEKIVDLNSSKDTLFNKAKLWVVGLVREPRYAIKTDDKESGTIIFHANTKFYYPYQFIYKKKTETGQEEGTTYFTMKIFLKDNKAKIVFTDIKIINTDLGSLNIEGFKKVKEPINEEQKKDYFNLFSLFRNGLHILDKIQEAFITYMNKKAENDF